MKKTISFILALFVISACTLTSFADESHCAMLKSLGFDTQISVAEDNNEDSYITRGDFAYLIGQLMIPELNSYNVSQFVFADVGVDDFYYNSVMHLWNAGIVNGADNLYFYPERKILKSEAMTMAVRLLGYEYRVDTKKSYESVAASLKLFSDMSDQQYMTSDDAYILMCNILNADISSYNLFDGERNTGEKRTMMSVRLGIYKTEGQVTDNGITSLYGESTTADGKIIVDNVVYINKSGSNDLLGKYIEGYYREENGEKILLFARSTGNSITFDAQDIKTFNAPYYEVYSDNDKLKKYTLKSNFKVVYNGAALSVSSGIEPDNLASLLNPELGSVTLISSSGNAYDTVMIRAYEVVVTRAVDIDKKIIYSHLKKPLSVNLTDYDIVNVYGLNGVRMDFSSITDYNVLYIYKSLNNEIADIYISSEYISGNVSEFNRKKHIIKIGDKDCEYEPLLTEDIDENILLTSSVTAYMGYDGKIVFIKISHDESALWAYLMNIDRGKGIADDVKLQLYTERNEVREVSLADNAKVNGIKCKSNNEAYDLLISDPYSLNNLVLVLFNSSGQVTNVDTAYYPASDVNNVPLSGESSNSIHIVNQIYQATKTIHKSRIGDGEIMLDETTKVFVVPANGEIGDVFVTTSSDPTVSKEAAQFKTTAYIIDDLTMLADAIVIYKNSAGYDITNAVVAQRNAQSVVVADIKNSINQYGNYAKTLTVTSGGYEYYVSTVTENGAKDKSTGKDVKIGDIIKYGTDKAGFIPDGQLAIMYSPEDDKENLIHNTGSFNGNQNVLTHFSYGLINGTVEMINTRYVKLVLPNSDRKIYPLAELKYVVYDSDARDKVFLGNQTDILSSPDSLTEGTRLILDLYSGNLRFAYIIK